MNPRFSSVFVLCAGLAAAPLSAMAAFPDKPIRVVMGFSAGGSTDIAFRQVQDEWSKRLGQSVVPEYKVGANGSIANEFVASAQPDGYTLLWTNVNPLTLNHYLYANSRVDPEKAFVPISQVTDSPLVVVVPKSSPFKTMKELIAGMKSSSVPLTYGSAGNGSSMHIAGAMLSVAVGATTTHVPYKGTGPAGHDLLGGRLDFMADSRSTSFPHIQSGALRALAVTSKTRVDDMPDVPTVAESGVADFNITTWQGVVAPVGTPPEVIRKLADTLRGALQSDVVKQRYARIQTPLVGSTPEEFGKFMAQQRVRAKWVVEQAKLRID